MLMAADKTAYLGRSVQRLEDPPLVTGQARFAADINFPNQLHMRMVRSSYAHGEIVSIDTSEAQAMPGVVAIWTAIDIADIGPVDFRADRAAEALKPYRQPVLAKGRVRYVGDPVAAVFAEDPYLAEDAAEAVVIEIEELPVIVSADDPPGEFAAGHGTEAAVMHHGYGDIDAAFANADTVIELDLRTGRHSGVPMETRGAIGRYDAANDILELHGAAKVPHRNQETLVKMLGRDASRMHLHECHVGGGFGIRGELYPEDILVLLAAMRLGRPVKWIEDRQEHLMCANQGREQHHLARVAVDAEGRILGIDDEFFHDQGAYIRTHGSNVANRTMCTITGPYRVPAFRAVCHFRLTNKTPCATYRAPGRYESTFVRERLIDAIAPELGIDPIEVRKRNLIAAAEMPYTIAFDEPHVSDMVLDSGDYAGLLDKAVAAFGWQALKVELARRRADGELVGAGIGMFIEEGGRGPTDGARIAVDINGEVEVITGGASLGQGFETAMAQICAEALGVDYRRVRVIHGHTDLIPYGIGAHATRATVMTGSAVDVAAKMVREIAIDAAAEMLQTPADGLDINDGTVARRNDPAGPAVTLGEIARRLAPDAAKPGQGDPGLAAEGFFTTTDTVFPYGVHLAVVRIDRGTGAVAVERFMVAYDVGRAVNPMMIEGQLVGGCIQGLGGALYEEFVYDEEGQPMAVTLADYLVPTLREAPDIEVLITEDAPSPLNPLGLKSAGEGGINGVGAAIAGAIGEAIGDPGAVRRLPLTPARVMDLLRRADAGSS
ncbi:MAG: xanthine dehydrogenase family protein molybdopterin-binding subunit [Proteobacteria bacterium]|nr:xanthine dehydrogenase family protein molybdopterin-binding subunit [Pseudomonadota bacterium]